MSRAPIRLQCPMLRLQTIDASAIASCYHPGPIAMNALRSNIRPLLLAIVILIPAASPASSDDRPQMDGTDRRLARVEQWLMAVMHHRPGEVDDPVRLVASWSNVDIGTLWVDVHVVVRVMRDPRRRMKAQALLQGQKPSERVPYTTPQIHRLMVLACAAGGILIDPECVHLNAASELDPELARLSRVAGAAARAGDDNYILRRGALLHADIAMLVRPRPIKSSEPGELAGPQRLRLDLADGQGVDFGQVAVQWELARMLLNFVRPAGARGAAPGQDDMVRRWYHATTAWMQQHENHDTAHMDRARALFPDDADILFLSGCQHEVFAGPFIQTVARSVVLPTGLTLDVASDANELRQAEVFFRRALVARPDFPEAHLRLGRVLLVRGRYEEALIELQRAIGSIEDDRLLYYCDLFVGAALEALGRFDPARASYRKAADRHPTAQSPRLALSALARRRGDRAAARRALQDVFELPSVDRVRDEPWWSYFVAQSRDAAALLEELWRPFREDTL